MQGAFNRDDLLEQLARSIFTGEYTSGEFLPREVDICHTYSVSRSTARSALQTLADTGILVRISGQGTRIRDPREWQLLDPRVTHWLTLYSEAGQFYMQDLLDFRASVEPFVTMEAATRASAADLHAIEDALSGMEAAWHTSHGGDIDPLFDVFDVAFHEAVYAATHNVIWTQLSHVLKPIILAQVARTNRTTDSLIESVACHRRIFEAIRLRERQQAGQATQAMLNRTAADLATIPVVAS